MSLANPEPPRVSKVSAGSLTVVSHAASADRTRLDPRIWLLALGTFALGTDAFVVAGLLPGIMLALMLGFVTWYIAKKNNYPRMKKATWMERLKFFKDSVWGLMLVVIIVGGIYSGIFTATEAAIAWPTNESYVYKRRPSGERRRRLPNRDWDRWPTQGRWPRPARRSRPAAHRPPRSGRRAS